MPWPTHQTNGIISPFQLWNKYTLYNQTKLTVTTTWWSEPLAVLYTLDSWELVSLLPHLPITATFPWFVAIRHSHRQPCCPTSHQNHFKQSKTDQYRQGTHIYLGRTSHQVFPVKAIIRYLDKCGGRPGSLIILPTNQLLIRATFSEALNIIFQKLNMHPPTTSIPIASELMLLHQPSKQASAALTLKL